MKRKNIRADRSGIPEGWRKFKEGVFVTTKKFINNGFFLMKMTIRGQTPTIIELVNTVESLGILKKTEAETNALLDSMGARAEFDQFNRYVRDTVGGAAELVYAYASEEGIGYFAELFTKVKGKPFDQDEVVVRR